MFKESGFSAPNPHIAPESKPTFSGQSGNKKIEKGDKRREKEKPLSRRKRRIEENNISKYPRKR